MPKKEIVKLVQQIKATTDPALLRELRKALIEAVALTPKR
jgi:hypothetical protein